MKLSEFATPIDTELYQARFPELPFTEFGSTRLTVSQVGFGCYRVHQQDAAHHQALAVAITSGINLIDTSTNYTDGSAEHLVGQVLSELSQLGQADRQQIVIITKAGYIQGQNLVLVKERETAGNPYPEVVSLSEDLAHCISPEFLHDQLTLSLDRIGLATIDGLLLHNPDYFLAHVHSQGVPLEEARDQYYDRIRRAFVHLESEVAADRIQFYGVSSNTFPLEASHPEFTSLTRLLEIAQSVSPDHHFKVIQLPFNLLETGAALTLNQPGKRSVLQAAADAQLAVMINRPLNAIVNQQLVRLAHFSPDQMIPQEEIQRKLVALQGIELQLKDRFSLAEDAPLLMGPALLGNWQSFSGPDRWKEVLLYYILPRIEAGLSQLPMTLPEADDVLVQRFLAELNTVCELISEYYKYHANRLSDRLSQTVSAADPDWAIDAPLSQKAVHALRSTAGVTTVLVGMRQRSYVEDILAELHRPISIRDRQLSWERLVI